jgi:predicted Zn-dependent protease with MMP-like domain/Flp pilus assembly protein TadD
MSRTDRLQADIERGFLALEEGRLDDAAASAERCQRIDRKNADVVTLAAAVADARGDVDEALAQYQNLAELRPDDAMPRICIARLELHDLQDPDAALATLAEAMEFIDEEADLVEAIFIRTEALIMNDALPAAREALAELASSVIDDPEQALDLAELALAAEDFAAATRWVEIARKDADLEADATHLLGRIHELANDRPAMIAAWQRVRELDAAAPAPSLAISDDELEAIAVETLAELPDNVREHLAKVPILIDTLPSAELVADGLDPRLLGLFQGTPMPEDGSGAPAVTNILLFKTNLERASADAEQLADEIRITVLHETAHYFGLDEEALEAIGLD